MNNQYNQKTLDHHANQIAYRIKNRRLELGLSEEKASALIGVTQSNYRTMEKTFGVTRFKKYCDRIANAFKVHPSWILTGTDDGSEFHYVFNGELLKNPKSSEDSEDRSFPLSHHLRNRLAQRLEKRRLALNISTEQIIRKTRARLSLIRQYEKKLPLDIDEKFEAKIEEIMQVPQGWLRDISIRTPIHINQQASLDTLGNNNLSINIKVGCATISEEIEETALILCMDKPLKKLKDIDMLSEKEKKYLNVFELRYGVHGEENTPIIRIAEKLGISKQRVFQILEKMINKSKILNIHSSKIFEIHQKINEILPCSVSSLNTKFRYLLGENLTIQSANRFYQDIFHLRIINTTTPEESYSYYSDLIAYDKDKFSADFYRIVKKTAHKLIRFCGAAQIDYLRFMINESMGSSTSKSDILKACQISSNFEWLDESSGWFWYGEKEPIKYALLNIAEKILTVNDNEVSLDDIAQGLYRTRQKTNSNSNVQKIAIEAPRKIILEVLSRTSFISKSKYDFFRLVTKIPISTALSITELKIYNYLVKNNWIANKRDLFNELVNNQNVNSITFHAVIKSSPILKKVDRSNITINGYVLNNTNNKELIKTNEKKLDALNESNKYKPIDGIIVYEFNLQPNHLKSNYLAIPEALAYHLIKDQPLNVDQFRTQTKYILRKKYCHGLYGLETKIRLLHFKINDLIAIKIDLNKNIVYINKQS